ncbi:CDP-alcohol phosphatidyltransferase family protein [Gaetbulibacter aestuarii]|uniref:CDP-alcohol phosphatidyltransferase family protein n=1 Tax=Gaetbulibacter aestuarii TaxID=1502358 RepID=A0ABW7MYR1_9FLAO
MKKYIPSALTLLNLLSGSIAILYVINNNYVGAAQFVFLGILFDFFDGFAARKLEVQSEFGLQLDSLADMVTSGVVPGLVMYKMLSLTTNKSFMQDIFPQWGSNVKLSGFEVEFLPLIGFAITLASAVRLARFNLDDEQQSYFKGLPTPANNLLIMSLPLILEFQENDNINAIILNKGFLIVVTLLSAYLLNANMKLFALKFKTYGFKGNEVRYIFLILSIIFIIILQFASIPVIIFMYLGLSALDRKRIQ